MATAEKSGEGKASTPPQPTSDETTTTGQECQCVRPRTRSLSHLATRQRFHVQLICGKEADPTIGTAIMNPARGGAHFSEGDKAACAWLRTSASDVVLRPRSLRDPTGLTR